MLETGNSDTSELEDFHSSSEAGSTPKRRVQKRKNEDQPVSTTVEELSRQEDIGTEEESKEDDLFVKHPSFCWVCHYKDADQDCGTCERSFHSECGKKFNKTATKRAANGLKLERCYECRVSNVTAFPRFKRLTTEELKLILLACCEKGNAWIKKELDLLKKSNDGIRKIWSEQIKALTTTQNAKNAGQTEFEEMQRTLRKVVSLQSVQEGIQCREIRTLESFAGEIRWIYHNSVIYNGRDTDSTEIIKDFVTDVFSDLNNRVWDCVECQLHKATKVKDRKPKFFLAPCQIPHPVIWAKMTGYPYWPAKMISSNTNDGTVSVFCFGDHFHAILKLEDCLTYSKIHPNVRDQKNKKLKAAIVEANKFIEILGKNQLVGAQTVEDKSGPLPNLTREFVKEKIFPQISPELWREMLHPTSTDFELDL